MKQQTKLLILSGALVLLLAAAAVGYRFLSQNHTPGSGSTASISDRVAAPDFAVLNEAGTVVNFSDFVGKPTVINFWATWCGPCRSEFPAFERAYAEHGDAVQFMMINLTDGSRDTVSSVKQFIEGFGYSFPVYFDTAYSAANAYGISPIPVSVFIDSEGRIAQTHTGAMTEAQLTQYLSIIMEE